jgi:hypothetical protein
MKVLVDESPGLQRPRNQAAEELVRTLIAGGVVEKETRELLLAVSRIANSLASHSAAGDVRMTPCELAAATVSATATAIALLSARLP